MRHFAQLDDVAVDDLFEVTPQPFDATSDPHLLATALGATLYSPGTRTDLVEVLQRRAAEGLVSSVLCLEDSIADHEVEAGIENVIAVLRRLDELDAQVPLLFIRIRATDQIPRIMAGIGGAARLLVGFVLPKFSETRGDAVEALEAVAGARERLGRPLYAMPVLETPDIMWRETRTDALLSVRRLVDKHRGLVLAARIGATDLCGLFGLRRGRDLTAYDVQMVREVIGDVVNVLGRTDDGVDAVTVTGPVWEYFAGPERIFASRLRVTPFAEAELPGNEGRRLRNELLQHDLDGLIREVVLDKANGLQGKTVIHPTHVAAVHSLMTVTHEEWVDTLEVLEASAGGVRRSAYANKMNEARPHRLWAERVVRRAQAFGVLREGLTFVELLAAAGS